MPLSAAVCHGLSLALLYETIVFPITRRLREDAHGVRALTASLNRSLCSGHVKSGNVDGWNRLEALEPSARVDGDAAFLEGKDLQTIDQIAACFRRRIASCNRT